ncbi:unnamed protein product [Rotaria socialis]|uniref:F-box domain-containing protein n=1 Tax=Rotaria socialis TaxID=392032 RepID=A0A821YWY6_9BILA|nr:unnamed protein product [Rotaria socialis]
MLMHKSAGSIQLSYRYDYMDISNYTLMPSNLISLKLFISDNMLSRLENLPDEILLMILSHIRWFELIESFWSLNQRFNALIHLKFSLNKNQIVISHRDVSFNP